MKIKYLLAAFSLIMIPAYAFAAGQETEEASIQPTCPDVKKIESCIPLGQGSFDEVKTYKLSEKEYLVTVHDKDASGDNNPYYWAFILKNGEMIDASSQNGGLSWVDVDMKNKILSSLDKASDSADTGNIEIYKINAETSSLDLLQSFRTDGNAGTYISETGDNDVAFGYQKRAREYIKAHNYDLKLNAASGAKKE